MAERKKKTKAPGHRSLALRIGWGILSAVSGLVALLLVAYSSFVIYDSLYTDRAAFSSWDLSKYRPSVTEEGLPSFEELLDINPDTVGWIKILGTNIDYPIVQGKDDVEYANKDVFGRNSLSGSIYLTAINTRDFTNSFNLIYGHHMDNGAMFGDIAKFENEDFFYTHQDGILLTTQGNYDLRIFARISTDAYDSKIYSAGDRKPEHFPEFLEYVESLAVQWDANADIYDFTEKVRTYLFAREANIAENGHFMWSKMPPNAIKNGLQLLAMSTCRDATTNGRQLLFATMKFRTEPIPEDMLVDMEEETVPSVIGHNQEAFCALVNLLCVILCVIIVLPGWKIPAKYGRARLMRRANKEGARYPSSVFRLRIVIGFLVEAGLTVFAVVWFLRTEDLHKRLTIADRWTPLMLAVTAVVLLTDILLFRYREKKKK